MNAGSTSVIFPNPTSGKISIYLDSLDEKAEIAIYDSRGKLVRRIQLSGSGEQQLEADLSGLSPGFYLFRVPTKSGWESHKIVLTK